MSDSMSPPAAQLLTRARSGSTLSCITVVSNNLEGSPSRTSPMADAQPVDVSADAPRSAAGAKAVRRVARTRRSNVATYNENVLAGSARRTSTRNMSGQTLVEDPMAQDLVGNGIKALDLDWSINNNAAAADGQKLQGSDKHQPLERRSSRLERLTKVKHGVLDTVSSLGKRGRDALEAGKQTVKDIAGGLQSNKSNMSTSDVTEDATNKKRKISKDADHPDGKESRPQAKQRSRRCLTQGLYVGQHKYIDPKLKESSNPKRAGEALSKIASVERKYLPMPMFAGQRLIDNGRDFKLPYDIFSPLPPGQSKPEEWKKTQKNVFVGESATIWKKKTKPLELSRCVCLPESDGSNSNSSGGGCGDNCQNRFMFYECDDSNCNVGAEQCTNRSFADLRQRCKAGGKYNIGVEVIKTADRGYGVRSNRSFEPQQIIVEYAGEIITQEECESRMNSIYKHNECYYLMLFDQNMIIDATRGSIARFVNHSCEPNCKMVKWTVDGKPRMALFAGDKGISTGDELTYDYNFDPFSVKNVQKCRCGAASCRGVLGPRPKESSGRSNSLKSGLENLLVNQAKNVKRKIEVVIGSNNATSDRDAKKTKRTVATPRSRQRATTASASKPDVKVRVEEKGKGEDALAGGKARKPSPLSSRGKGRNVQKDKKPVKKLTKAEKRGPPSTLSAAVEKGKAVQTAARSMARSVRGQRRAAASSSSAATAGMGQLGGLNRSGSTIRVIADGGEA
ncbi:MAG: hypothetical protein M1825_005299 [Sarcosagium campestre]|nr:MAG: hypothetical protein M1825_005299 [Sarcosagium campestre]